MEPHFESAETHHLASNRPFKIARSENLSYRGASVSDVSDHAGRLTATVETDTDAERQRVRTRANTACQTCRARKTKCDNLRPRCSYCMRVQAECSYVEDGQRPHACDVFGPKILDAIESLSNLIQHRQSSSVVAPSPVASIDTYASPFAQILDARTENYYDYASHAKRPSTVTEEEKSVLPPARLGKRAFAPQGLEQILEWNVFPPGTSHCASQHELTHGPGAISAQASRLPEISFATLTRLKTRYIAGVHVKNPFLDISQLDELILEVVECGFDWSVETCLVALACSIGALAETFGSNFRERDASTPHGAHIPHEDADMDLAMQFWNVAVKRLGLVIGENSLIAVQCLCLAGEIRLELPLPPSILGDIDTQYSFPYPPQFDLHLPYNDPLDAERGWYYYLAEIAARHLFNHLLRTRSANSLTPLAKSITTLIAQLSLFEPQVNEWYTSLPAQIKFALPSGSIAPLRDELSQILRGRYLALRVLLYRPFIQLCVENDLCDSVPHDIVEQVTGFASQGLAYSVYKMQGMVTKRHQGTWSILREQLTYVSTVLAATRADKRKYTDRRAMAKVVIPAGWREATEGTLKRTSSYWDEEAGIGKAGRLLRDMLGEEVESGKAS